MGTLSARAGFIPPRPIRLGIRFKYVDQIAKEEEEEDEAASNERVDDEGEAQELVEERRAWLG